MLSCAPAAEFLGRWESDVTALVPSSAYSNFVLQAVFVAPNVFSWTVRARGRSTENQGCLITVNSTAGTWSNTVAPNGVASLTLGPTQADTGEITGCQDGRQNRARVTLTGSERGSVIILREGAYTYSVAGGSLILSSPSVGGSLTLSRVP